MLGAFSSISLLLSAIRSVRLQLAHEHLTDVSLIQTLQDILVEKFTSWFYRSKVPAQDSFSSSGATGKGLTCGRGCIAGKPIVLTHVLYMKDVLRPVAIVWRRSLSTHII